jgi:tetratricopeptide (TPR) repeat protein
MRAFSWARLAVAGVLILSSISCAKFNELKGMKAYKAANVAYQAQDYPNAAKLYEEAIAVAPDLAYGEPYFFLGNSYDNMYKPSRKGEPDNDVLLEKAVKNYEIAAAKLSVAPDERDKNLGQLSLQYLVAAYGSDKLNDPAKAEPVVQKMIQLDPSDPNNYFALGKIYEDAGVYDEAEKVYVMARDVKPEDSAVYLQLAGFYNRQGEFPKTIEALEQRAAKEPNNPEAFHTIASFYWDETQKDTRLTDADKRSYIQKGLEAEDKALQLRGDYIDALVFKGLLLRLEANLEKDLTRQTALIREADTLRDQADELRKQKQATTTSQ